MSFEKYIFLLGRWCTFTWMLAYVYGYRAPGAGMLKPINSLFLQFRFRYISKCSCLFTIYTCRYRAAQNQLIIGGFWNFIRHLPRFNVIYVHDKSINHTVRMLVSEFFFSFIFIFIFGYQLSPLHRFAVCNAFGVAKQECHAQCCDIVCGHFTHWYNMCVSISRSSSMRNDYGAQLPFLAWAWR